MTTTLYSSLDPSSYSGYTVWQPGGATYSVAIQVAKAGTLKRIGYWSPPTGVTTDLPESVGLFEEGNTTPILQQAATWSGAHGTGWIWATVPDTTLDTGKTYYAVIGVNLNIDQGYVYPGDALVPRTSDDGNITNPATVTNPAGPANPYENSTTFGYPATAPPGAFTWMIDVDIDFGTVTPPPTFTVTEGTTVNGVTSYSVDADENDTGNAGVQTMRVLVPDSPSGNYPHGILWMLPVEPGQGTTYGDGIGTAQALGIHNTYNLTCIQPGFPIDPWYGDNPSDPQTQQETFILDLRNWVNANLAPGGDEKHYLIGFSKSGFGGQVLFLRHQDLFEAVASWDMAGDYQTLSQYDGGPVFGDQATLDGYKLYDPNLTTWKAAGDTGTRNRIWLGAGINLIQATEDYSARLTADGILHTYVRQDTDTHNWAPNPGWVGPAVASMLGVKSEDAMMSFTII